VHNSWAFTGIAVLGHTKDLINIYKYLYGLGARLLDDDITGCRGWQKKLSCPEARVALTAPAETYTA